LFSFPRSGVGTRFGTLRRPLRTIPVRIDFPVRNGSVVTHYGVAPDWQGRGSVQRDVPTQERGNENKIANCELLIDNCYFLSCIDQGRHTGLPLPPTDHRSPLTGSSRTIPVRIDFPVRHGSVATHYGGSNLTGKDAGASEGTFPRGSVGTRKGRQKLPTSIRRCHFSVADQNDTPSAGRFRSSQNQDALD